MTFRLHPALRLLVCVLGLVFILVLIGQVFVSARQFAVRVGGPGGELSGADALVATLFSYPPLIAWLWFCRRTFDGLSLRSLGLHGARGGRLFLAGVLGGALAVAVLWGVLRLLGAIAIEGPSDFAFDANALRTGGVLLLWAGAFCAVAFIEELLFRGYLGHNLGAWLGPRLGVAAQAALFALIHLPNVWQRSGHFSADVVATVRGMEWGVPNLILFGVFAALSLRKTGSLWFPIGFHAGWNFFLGCVFSLPVSGIEVPALFRITSAQTVLTGGTFGAEGSILLTPLLLIACVLAARAADHPQAALDFQLSKDGPPALPIAPPAPEAAAPFAPEEAHENRFRTRFGDGSPLDAPPEPVQLPPVFAPFVPAPPQITLQNPPFAPGAPPFAPAPLAVAFESEAAPRDISPFLRDVTAQEAPPAVPFVASELAPRAAELVEAPPVVEGRPAPPVEAPRTEAPLVVAPSAAETRVAPAPVAPPEVAAPSEAAPSEAAPSEAAPATPASSGPPAKPAAPKPPSPRW